jgi:hypothetical protein
MAMEVRGQQCPVRQYCVDLERCPAGRFYALSDIPPDSRSVRRDLTFEQDAAQRNWIQLPPFAAKSSGWVPRGPATFCFAFIKAYSHRWLSLSLA